MTRYEIAQTITAIALILFCIIISSVVTHKSGSILLGAISGISMAICSFTAAHFTKIFDEDKDNES